MKEIERLDAEDSSPATPTTNGHAKKDTATVGEVVASVGEAVSKEAEMVKGVASDIVADLKGASLEDKE
jgi:hypothetical protein